MAGDQQRGSGYGLGLSTRTQVTGYQFLARRTAMALTRWRVRMEIEHEDQLLDLVERQLAETPPVPSNE